MKILRLKGYFRSGPLEGAYFSVLLSIPSIGIEDNLELLVDTGATKTTILDSDAKKLGIQYDKLSKLKQPLLGLGGLVETLVAREVSLYFGLEKPTVVHREYLDEVLVVRHTNPEANIMRIPSVLGRDIINKYHLNYDKPNLLVTIED